MRRHLKRIVHYGLKSARSVAVKHPRIKNTLKRVITPYIGGVAKQTDNYNKWVQGNLLDFTQLPNARKEAKDLKHKPLISVIVPTYDTDHAFLRECFDSVLGQVYENWELIIVDDASPDAEVRSIIEEYAKLDDRIKYKFLNKNMHISGATNAAIAISSGEYVSLFDHDDMLWPNALLEIAKAVDEDKTRDFIYTDEDKITEDRHEHLGYFFKPDWNPDFLLSVNYITHLTTFKRSLFDEIGGFRSEYDGAQDWDLVMRMTHVAKNIHHIPKILYSWRIHSASTAKDTGAKPYVVEAQRKVIQSGLDMRGYPNAIVQQDEKHSGYWRVEYPVTENPKISIVIPSKNQYKVIKRCIDSIYQKTTYQNYEIIVVDTGSDDSRVLEWYGSVASQHSNFTVIDFHEKPFSYAKSCNYGASKAQGSLLVMLNNDTEVITPEWLENMAGDAQRKEVGAVGALLFFPGPQRYIQHAGVGVGLGGVAGNMFQMMTLDQPMSQTQHLMLNTKHNMTAVTAACMMLRKEVYDEVGGFDETYRVTYNDVDLCLRLHEKGYRNIYTPYAQLVHYESISVGLPEELAKRDTKEMKDATEQFVKQWKKYIDHDPNVNPNMDKYSSQYDIPQQVSTVKGDE